MNYRKEASEQVSDANILDAVFYINVNLSEGCVDPVIGMHLTNL